jgi:hypothetical protein
MLGGVAPARPSARWDPFRPVDMLTSLWSFRPSSPVGMGTGAGIQSLFETLRKLVVGRRITVQLTGDEVTIKVTEFDARLDVRSLSVGQLNDVHIAGEDISWNGRKLERATAVLRNAHLRPISPPVLVAAPVEVSLEVPTAMIEDLLARAAPQLVGEVAPDGIAILHLARKPTVGGLEVTPRLDGSTLWLQPRSLLVRSKRWALPHRVPAYPVRLPEFPHGLRITGVDLATDVVHLSGELPEWRMEMPRSRLEKIITQLDVAGRQPTVTWWGARAPE